MVSKITIFEPHFDGAQFGPTSIGDEESPAEQAPEEIAESEPRGRSPGRAMLAVGGITMGLLLGFAALRRARSSESEPLEIEDGSISTAPMEA